MENTMSDKRLITIAEQSQFYRNNFRRLLRFMFVLILLAYGLLGLIIYQHYTRPPAQYFVTTSDGQLTEISPVPLTPDHTLK